MHATYIGGERPDFSLFANVWPLIVLHFQGYCIVNTHRMFRQRIHLLADTETD